MNVWNSSKWKALGALVITLLIGALLGAALVGTAMRQRSIMFLQFSTPEGFTERVLSIVEPVSDEQLKTILPIVQAHGEEVYAKIRESRATLIDIGQSLSDELQPHLSEEQKKRLAERRAENLRRVAEMEEAQNR
ncbi:MAG: hypothetical protein AAGG55_08805 [Pseudomonadota bacterium]